MSTLKEIADRTGVSVSTVSRVLRDPEYRSGDPGKRDEIWATAMELGYSPNAAARALKAGGSLPSDMDPGGGFSISILMTRTDEAQSDPFFSEVLRVAQTELNRRLCLIDHVWYRTIFSDDRRCRSENLERLIDNMRDESARNDNGLIIIGRCNREALLALKKAFRNVVSINRNPTHGEIDEVSCDGRQIAMDAVEYLISQGYRDIGYAGSCSGEQRYEGYLSTLSKHSLDVNPSSIRACKATESEGFRVMEAYLSESDMPDAVFCANDIIAVGMLKYLRVTKHRKLPFAIIGSDDIAMAQEMDPMLTTIALPCQEMARFAVSILLDRIAGGHNSTVSMILQTRLMKRESA